MLDTLINQRTSNETVALTCAITELNQTLHNTGPKSSSPSTSQTTSNQIPAPNPAPSPPPAPLHPLHAYVTGPPSPPPSITQASSITSAPPTNIQYHNDHIRDDTSVTSYTRNSDKILPISKYTHNIQQPGNAQNFIEEVKTALTAVLYYHPILSNGHDINYDIGPTEENKTLYQQLISKLDNTFLTAMRTVPEKLGTSILKTISSCYQDDAFRKSQIEQAQKQMLNDQWDPSPFDFNSFIRRFSNNAATLATSTNPPTSKQLKGYWINSLPSKFSSVKEPTRKALFKNHGNLPSTSPISC
mmetsp:Transcript_12613/g.19400  ORF Transcript_12613/g.19400 Transcript_12613/m.19400 type:complete len:301 (-) Transcript_12613:574-1476(-)